MKTLLLFLTLFSTAAFGRSFKLVELDEVSVQAYDIISKRDPYFPQMQVDDWGQGANFIINTHLLEYTYWNNRLHLSGDNSQIRHVGWEFTSGLHLIEDTLDAFYYHHSEHVTEEAREDIFSNSSRQFPVEDLVGIKLYLYKK